MVRLRFTKSDVMMALYSTTDSGRSGNEYTTYETTKIRVRVWHDSSWLEVLDLGLRKSYIVYGNKLFDCYYTGPYNFIYCNMLVGVFNIKGEKITGYICGNGWVRDGHGKFLTKLKEVKEW
jgi:hypothetical protein